MEVSFGRIDVTVLTLFWLCIHSSILSAHLEEPENDPYIPL